MAGREGYIEGKPIVITNFRSAIDEEYINTDITRVETLLEADNLTPHRKLAALKTTDGTTPYKDNLPNPEGYELIDWIEIPFDRDSQKVMVLFYHREAGENILPDTKIYVNPYYNPTSDNSNYSPRYSEQGKWINEWVELTERYEAGISSVYKNEDSNYIILNTVVTSEKLDNYFIANLSLEDENAFERYNIITYSTIVNNNNNDELHLSLFSRRTDNWGPGHRVLIVKYPVLYFYNRPEEGTHKFKYNANPPIDQVIFDPVPTSLVPSINELRIGCGKDKRPLILQFLDKREYFAGNVVIDETRVGKIIDFEKKDDSLDIYKNDSNGHPVDPTIEIQSENGIGADVRLWYQLHTVVGNMGFETYENVYNFLLNHQDKAYYIINGWIQLKDPNDPNPKVIGRSPKIKVYDLYSFTENGTTHYTLKIRPFNNDDSDWGSFLVDWSKTINNQLSITPESGDPDAPSFVIWTNVRNGSGLHIDLGVDGIEIISGGSGYKTGDKLVCNNSNECGGGNLEWDAIVGNPRVESTPNRYDGLYLDLAQIPQTFDVATTSAYYSLTFNGGMQGKNTMYIGLLQLENNNKFRLLVSSEPISGCAEVVCESGWITFGIFVVDKDTFESMWDRSDKVYYDNVYGRTSILLYTDPGGSKFFYILDPSYNWNVFKWSISNKVLGEVIVYGLRNVASLRTSGGNEAYQEIHYMEHTYKGVLLRSNPANLFGGGEANGRTQAINKFLNIAVYTPPFNLKEDKYSITRNFFIFSAFTDRRNEIIVALGTLCPLEGYGLHINIGLWFSRRITDFNFYNQPLSDKVHVNTDTNYSVISCTSDYPYFIAPNPLDSKQHRINEIPLYMTFSIKSMTLNRHGELATYMRGINTNMGLLFYVYRVNEGYYQVRIADGGASGGVDLTQEGTDFKWIVNTNRFIDARITLNYTHATYIGGINGRFIITGVKGKDDYIFINNLAAGLSQYDIFIEDDGVPIKLGDAGIVQSIANYNNSLLVAKDTNINLLDLAVDSQFKYRVITLLEGVGVNSKNAMTRIPGGIAIATTDTVYLFTAKTGLVPLLSSSNGKLLKYQELVNSTGSTVSLAYYRPKNELLVFINTQSEHYIYSYSFNFKSWSIYNLGSINCVLPKANEEGKVLFYQKYNNVAKIERITEFNYEFCGNKPEWKLETPFLVPAGRLASIKDPRITIVYEIKEDMNITVRLIREDDTKTQVREVRLDKTKNIADILFTGLLPNMPAIKIQITGKGYIVIKSITICIKHDSRILFQPAEVE